MEKYTKENFTEFYVSFHFLYNSSINLIPLPDCYICIGLLVDTHIGLILSHMAIGQYGHNPKILPNGLMPLCLGEKGNAFKQHIEFYYSMVYAQRSFVTIWLVVYWITLFLHLRISKMHSNNSWLSCNWRTFTLVYAYWKSNLH